MNTDHWRAVRALKHPEDSLNQTMESVMHRIDSRGARLKHPNPAAFGLALAAFIRPIQSAAMMALAGDQDGITDGRSVWIKPEALAQHPYQSIEEEQWFGDVLLAAASAATRTPQPQGTIMKVVTTDELLGTLAQDGVDVQPGSQFSQESGYGQGDNPLPQAMAWAEKLFKASPLEAITEMSNPTFGDVPRNPAWGALPLPDFTGLDPQALGSRQMLALTTLNEIAAKRHTGEVKYQQLPEEERHAQALRTAQCMRHASCDATATAYLVARLNTVLGTHRGSQGLEDHHAFVRELGGNGVSTPLADREEILFVINVQAGGHEFLSGRHGKRNKPQ